MRTTSNKESRMEKLSSNSSSLKLGIRFKWIQEENMMYELEESFEKKTSISEDDGWSEPKKRKKKGVLSKERCRGCDRVENKYETKFSMCANCGTARYCSKKCQIEDWKRSHKKNCKQYAKIRKGETIDHRSVIERLLSKSHMYLNPFFIAKRKERGCGGFLYLNSPNTLEQLYLTLPIDINGKSFSRDVIARFVSMDDFRGMIKVNFELAAIVKKLCECDMDSKEPVPVVVMLRCGVFVLLEISYSPSYVVCERMSGHHAKDEKLQFSLD